MGECQRRGLAKILRDLQNFSKRLAAQVTELEMSLCVDKQTKGLRLLCY